MKEEEYAEYLKDCCNLSDDEYNMLWEADWSNKKDPSWFEWNIILPIDWFFTITIPNLIRNIKCRYYVLKRRLRQL